MFMPRALAKTVDTIARQTVGKDWSLYSALLEHWQEIVGPDYARLTTPVKITFPHQPNEPRRSGGTLCIRLPKGLAMEFTFKTDQIKQRINSYFGYDAIYKVVFDPIFYVPAEHRAPALEPNPDAIAEIRESSKAVDDIDLQQALAGLGEAVLKAKPQDRP